MAEENLTKAQEETEYTQEQQTEIDLGRGQGLDTSIYENPAFMPLQMRQIRMGLEEGIDVSVYAKPEYDWFQMVELRTAIDNKTDYSTFADPSIGYAKMRQLRKAAEDGVDLSAYMEKPAGVLKEVRIAKKNGIDIDYFISEGYDGEQLEQIRLALANGVDMAAFLDHSFRSGALEEIRIGLEKDLDVSVYAKMDYNWKQMHELRIGLEHHVDVKKYSNSLYSSLQMHEIRMGLEDGLEVDSYRLLRFSATDMHKKRLALMGFAPEDRSKKRQPIFDEDVLENAFEDGEDADLPFTLLVTPDQMEARIAVKRRDETLNEEAVLHALWKAGIKKGILRREIQEAVEPTTRGVTFTVAIGKHPDHGKDGYFVYKFDTENIRRPRVLPDGSVDYQNVDWFNTVKVDDVIAIYHPAETGSDGYTIRGDVVNGSFGKDIPALRGKGFITDDAKLTYKAAVDGFVQLKNGKLGVSNMLTVRDVTLATGKVVFNGSVHVLGSVGTGAEIRAASDVVIEGFVEGGSIESGGNILLKKGINANNKGSITASGNIDGRFAENATIRAGGDVQFNYCLNCEVEAGGQVKIVQRKGSLMGGKISAVRGIIANNVGSKAGKYTHLQVGINDTIVGKVKKLKADMKNCAEELKVFTEAKEKLEATKSSEELAENETYLKLDDAIYTKKMEKEDLELQKEELEEEIKSITDSKVVINGMVYDGVIVEINGKQWKAQETLGVTIQKSDGDELSVERN
ncbi:MAG: DUF342 domain-containing protein [Lachnospiraceae bacterium]|nr:DUF342 domain-containing protein [Lachnospiraceae bacterium]